MQPDYFHRFAPRILAMTQQDIRDADRLRSALRIASAGELEVCYTPMEHVNRAAKVVIVGITPGMTQLVHAALALRQQLQLRGDREAALMAARETGAFSGAIRTNLIKLLDAVGLHGALQLESCSSLFGSDAAMVQTTSVLRNAVFLRGGNYNGNPNMTTTPLLKDQLLTHFADDVRYWPNAVFIPLGDKVADALHFLSDQGLMPASRVLAGLPHPSGANAERIAYFLGAKSRQHLSAKTDPDRLDRNRVRLSGQVKELSHRSSGGSM